MRNAYLVREWKTTEGAFTKCANYSIKTEILTNNEKGHCELALTLFLCDLICFTLLKSRRVPWQMGFGRSRGGGIEIALLGKVHISKQNTLISPILFLQTMPPSLWTTAKDGMEVRRGKAIGGQNAALIPCRIHPARLPTEWPSSLGMSR